MCCPQTVSQLMALFNHNASLAILKNIAFTIVANINDLKEAKPTITTSKLAHIIHKVIDDGYLRKDSKVEMMCDLSILEMSLIIAMKHHNDIYDRDPFNFEIILTRLHKFQNSSEYSMGNYNREVVLKAFDVLKVRIFFLADQSFERFLIMLLFFSLLAYWPNCGNR